MLWGAALIAGAVLSLAVEAVWSTRLWVGCAVVGFVVVDMFWLTPAVFENIVWNAYFPLPFFVATLALAWVVGGGSFGWWPALVFTASVAAQAHLLFSLPCAVLALAAPVIGLVVHGRPERLRWLVVGAAVGVACWIAPVLQQLFGKDGNLSALLGSQSGLPKLGLHFSLSLLGRIAHLPPIWVTHQPITIFQLAGFNNSAGAASGVVMLALVLACAVWAWATGRRHLAALAVTALSATISFVVVFAIFPTKNALDVLYLVDVLWPLGIMIWVVVAWSISTLVADIVHRTRGDSAAFVPVEPAEHDVSVSRLRRRRSASGPWPSCASWASLGCAASSPTRGPSVGIASTPLSVVTIARAVERAAPKGPVGFTVVNGPTELISQVWIAEGVGWQLESDGWTPGLKPVEEEYMGVDIPVGTEYTSVVVTMDGTRVASVSTSPCRTGEPQCPGFG